MDQEFLEAPPGIEPGMEVLQTSALPLGDGAVERSLHHIPTLQSDRQRKPAVSLKNLISIKQPFTVARDDPCATIRDMIVVRARLCTTARPAV
jgi:hypothetical protein